MVRIRERMKGEKNTLKHDDNDKKEMRLEFFFHENDFGAAAAADDFHP